MYFVNELQVDFTCLRVYQHSWIAVSSWLICWVYTVTHLVLLCTEVCYHPGQRVPAVCYQAVHLCSSSSRHQENGQPASPASECSWNKCCQSAARRWLYSSLCTTLWPRAITYIHAPLGSRQTSKSHKVFVAQAQTPQSSRSLLIPPHSGQYIYLMIIIGNLSRQRSTDSQASVWYFLWGEVFFLYDDTFEKVMNPSTGASYFPDTHWERTGRRNIYCVLKPSKTYQEV